MPLLSQWGCLLLFSNVGLIVVSISLILLHTRVLQLHVMYLKCTQLKKGKRKHPEKTDFVQESTLLHFSQRQAVTSFFFVTFKCLLFILHCIKRQNSREKREFYLLLHSANGLTGQVHLSHYLLPLRMLVAGSWIQKLSSLAPMC